MKRVLYSSCFILEMLCGRKDGGEVKDMKENEKVRI
jgi:hypothetical protein